MALVTFNLAPLKAENSYLLNTGIDNLSASIAEENIDKITTVLIVDVNDDVFPGQIEYRFVESKAIFKTNNPQSLYIPLVCYDTSLGTESPRFQLDHVSSEAPILFVEHLQVDSTTGARWVKAPPFSIFPSDAHQARITFTMPRDANKRYKLNIGIYDAQEKKPVECDPLVGNDPP
jgi:hypothetical protein